MKELWPPHVKMGPPTQKKQFWLRYCFMVVCERFNVGSSSPPPGCSEPLGLKSGVVLDSQLSSSSVYRTLGMGLLSWGPEQARLDRQGKVNAWTPSRDDQKQWLQVRGTETALPAGRAQGGRRGGRDRKSTRLNSSH